MSRGAPYFISGDSAAALSPVLHYLHNERTMIYEEAYFNKNLTDKTIEEGIDCTCRWVWYNMDILKYKGVMI